MHFNNQYSKQVSALYFILELEPVFYQQLSSHVNKHWSTSAYRLFLLTIFYSSGLVIIWIVFISWPYMFKNMYALMLLIFIFNDNRSKYKLGPSSLSLSGKDWNKVSGSFIYLYFCFLITGFIRNCFNKGRIGVTILK